MTEVWRSTDYPLSMISAADVGFAIFRWGDLILSADAGFERIVDRSLPELLGLRIESLAHPDDLACSAWLLDQARDTGATIELRMRYLLPQGGVRWVENHIVPLVWAHEAPVFLVASREVSQPVAAPSRRAAMQDYVTDLTHELAGMAGRAGLGLGGEMLALAARVLDATAVEGGSWRG